MQRRLIPFLAGLILAISTAATAQTMAFQVEARNGATDDQAGGVEVAFFFEGGVLAWGDTNGKGIYESAFEFGGDQKSVSVSVSSHSYLEWNGYPEWACEIVFPAVPTYALCKARIRLVPRVASVPLPKRVKQPAPKK